jgi:hypothetical protein
MGINLKDTVKSERLLLNLNNPSDLDEAVRRLVEENRVIAVNFRTFGLLGHAETEADTLKISLPKGITKPKPHTLILQNIDSIIPAIDTNRIHPLLLPIINHPHEFSKRVAHLTHVRIPVSKNALVNGIKLHPGVLSFEHDDPQLPLAQFLIFTGKPQEFITKAYNDGLKLGAVTSMNFTSEPTITSVKKALEFLERSHMDTLIYQPDVHIEPSYPGIALSRTGVTLIREGHIPTETIIGIWQDVPFQIAKN